MPFINKPFDSVLHEKKLHVKQFPIEKVKSTELNISISVSIVSIRKRKSNIA